MKYNIFSTKIRIIAITILLVSVFNFFASCTMQIPLDTTKLYEGTAYNTGIRYHDNTPETIDTSYIWGDSNGPELLASEREGFVISVLGFVGETFAAWAIGKGIDELFSSLFEDPSQAKIKQQLSMILGMIDTINEELKRLAVDTRLNTYEKAMLVKLHKAINLSTHSAICWENIKSIPSTATAADKQILLKKYLKAWAESPVNGAATTLEATTNYALLLMSNVLPSTAGTYYEIYDSYAYNFFPWEHMGYAFRQDMRDADVAIFASSAILSLMYYNINKTENKAKIANLQALTKRYDEYDKKFKVTRNDNLFICQIIGCTGIRIGKKLRESPISNFKPHRTLRRTLDGSEFDSFYFENKMCSVDFHTRLINYYRKSLWDIAKYELKMNLSDISNQSPTIKKRFMTAGGWTTKHEAASKNYWAYVTAVNGEQDGSSKIDAGRWQVGCAWCYDYDEHFRAWDSYWNGQIWVWFEKE